MRFNGSESVYEGDWLKGARHGTGTLYLNAQRTTYYQGGLSGRACKCVSGVSRDGHGYVHAGSTLHLHGCMRLHPEAVNTHALCLTYALRPKERFLLC